MRRRHFVSRGVAPEGEAREGQRRLNTLEMNPGVGVECVVGAVVRMCMCKEVIQQSSFYSVTAFRKCRAVRAI